MTTEPIATLDDLADELRGDPDHDGVVLVLRTLVEVLRREKVVEHAHEPVPRDYIPVEAVESRLQAVEKQLAARPAAAPEGGPVLVACETCKREEKIVYAASPLKETRYWVRACAQCVDKERLARPAVSSEEVEQLRADVARLQTERDDAYHQLESYAEAAREAVAEEKEACAQACDAIRDANYGRDQAWHVAKACAARIRSRSSGAARDDWPRAASSEEVEPPCDIEGCDERGRWHYCDEHRDPFADPDVRGEIAELKREAESLCNALMSAGLAECNRLRADAEKATREHIYEECRKREAFEAFLLKLVEMPGGAVVSSNVCSDEEVVAARACDRFYVDDRAYGYVIRPNALRGAYALTAARAQGAAEAYEEAAARLEAQAKVHEKWTTDSGRIEPENVGAIAALNMMAAKLRPGARAAAAGAEDEDAPSASAAEEAEPERPVAGRATQAGPPAREDHASPRSGTSPPPCAAHAYTSTACHHARHDRCRRTCKFCDAACACACHTAKAAPPCAACGGFHGFRGQRCDVCFGGEKENET